MPSLTTTLDRFSDAPGAPFATMSYVGGVRARRQTIPVVNLIDALAAQYPVICRLLGGDSFHAAVRQYIFEEAPGPANPGNAFPRFLRNLRQGGSTDYLADVAELELARTRAYHAADERPVSAAAFATLSPERLGDLQMRLHPSVQLVSSRFPIVTIWEVNQTDGGMIERWGAEAALVARPCVDVRLRRLLPGGFAFLRSLAGGRTMAQAVDAALADAGDFDVVGNLAMLVESNIVVELREHR